MYGNTKRLDDTLDRMAEEFERSVNDRGQMTGTPLVGPNVEARQRDLRARVVPGGVRPVGSELAVGGVFGVKTQDALAGDPLLRAATARFVEGLTRAAITGEAPAARRRKARIELLRRSNGPYNGYSKHPAHPTTETFYGRGVLGIWYRDTVARVHALESIYQPFGNLANDERTPIDPVASTIFRYTADGRGIRNRGAIAEECILEAARLSSRSQFCVLSLACGAARPVLEAGHRLALEGRHITVELRDVDPGALQCADRVARQLNMRLPGGSSLLRPVVGLTDLLDRDAVASLAPADVVEALGIVEYFSGRQAEAFLRTAFNRVRQGGRLLFGNMLRSHPQLSFNRRVVHWPGLYPRSLQEMVDLAERCGVPRANVSIYLPEDGAYAVYEWHRTPRSPG